MKSSWLTTLGNETSLFIHRGDRTWKSNASAAIIWTNGCRCRCASVTRRKEWGAVLQRCQSFTWQFLANRYFILYNMAYKAKSNVCIQNTVSYLRDFQISGKQWKREGRQTELFLCIFLNMVTSFFLSLELQNSSEQLRWDWEGAAQLQQVPSSSQQHNPYNRRKYKDIPKSQLAQLPQIMTRQCKAWSLALHRAAFRFCTQQIPVSIFALLPIFVKG